MALTAAAALLTNAHRDAQNQVRSALLARLVRLWPSLDPTRVDETFDGWAQAAKILIDASHSTSGAVASKYFQTFRALEIGASGPAPPIALTLPTQQTFTSLFVTGPVAIKRLSATGIGVAAAARQALVMHVGSGGRLALAGGRETISAAVQADPRARGYQRVTGGNPCQFCSMLADRGAVYKEDTADFEAHDHCNCGAEPVFD